MMQIKVSFFFVLLFFLPHLFSRQPKQYTFDTLQTKIMELQITQLQNDTSLLKKEIAMLKQKQKEHSIFSIIDNHTPALLTTFCLIVGLYTFAKSDFLAVGQITFMFNKYDT